MFDPDTLENHNEFIEIYNSSTMGIDLLEWMIGDSLELDLIVDAGLGTILNPGEFGVILDGSYFGNSHIYDNLIPPFTLILKIDDGSFGKSGWSNTQSEPVILVNASQDTVQKYYYSVGNSGGISDEKILLSPDNSKDNWSNSTAFRGTPGKINSVSPLEWDIALDSCWIDPGFPLENSSFSIWIRIYNKGLSTIEKVPVKIFEDLNLNQRADINEIMVTHLVNLHLIWNEKEWIEIKLDGLPAGFHPVSIFLDNSIDLKPEDNIKIINILIESVQNPIVVNEIMFRPLSEFSEWIELLNISTDMVNLVQWKIADLKDTVTFTNYHTFIQPNECLVVCGDSSTSRDYKIEQEKIIILEDFPILNNDKDRLKIFSPGWRVIDSVYYSEDWMRREVDAGISLERINPDISGQIPDNWAASIDAGGSTPGKKNSVFFKTERSQSFLHISPNPFSPDGDGFEDEVYLSYNIPTPTAFLSIDIFDIVGRRIRRLTHQLPIGSAGSISWDGRDDDGRIARIGLYILLIRISENFQNYLKESKKSVVLIKN